MTSGKPAFAQERGFALIETLIAIAIVATMMAVMFESISTNARTTNAMIERRRAVLVAKSILDQAIIGRDGPARGTDGDLQWQVAFEPYGEGRGQALSLDLVTVTVMRSDSRQPLLRLRSLRMNR